MELVGENLSGAHLVYFSPSSTDVAGGIVRDLSGILDRVGGFPWIWIIDCQKASIAQAANMELTRGLIAFFRGKDPHIIQNLQSIYLIRPPSFIGGCLALLKGIISPNSAAKIHTVATGSLLEMYQILQKGGVTGQAGKRIIDLIEKTGQPGHH